MITLQRDVTTAALSLSLYLRDSGGEPRAIGQEAAPLLVVEAGAAPTELARLQELAAARRPELVAYGWIRRRLLAEVDLAENDALPQVELTLVVSRDVGDPQSYGPATSRPEAEALGTLSFAWPVQASGARGKVARGRARLRMLDAEIALVTDTMRQEVEAAYVGFQAAQDRAEVAARALEAAHQLEDAERTRFRVGSSDLLSVNLREEAAAQSAEALVVALADLQLASALVAIKTGRLPGEP